MSNAAAVRAGRAYVELFTDDSRLTAGLKAAVAKMKAFGQSVQAVGQSMVQVGAAIGLPLALSAKRFADFDDQMRAVQAVTQATEADFKALTEEALRLGRETSYTAVEAGALMLELGRAGFAAKQVREMSAAVLDLARATGTEAALASGIMAASIRQFGLEAKDAVRVADVLTTGANKTFNTVETIGEALQYVGPVARDFNMTLEDTVAVIGALGNAGIRGSNAGTAFRRLLIITGAEAKKVGEIFGIVATDAAGNARPLVDLLEDINAATKNLGTAARAQKFDQLFGLLGITGASVIGKAVGSTRELAKALYSAGGAARKASEQMDAGLGGSIRIVISSVEGAAIAIGGAMAPALQVVGALLIDGFNALGSWANENKALITIVGASVTVLIAMGGAMIAVGLAVKLAAFGLTGFIALLGAVKLPVAILMGTVAAFQAMNASLIAVGTALKAVGVAFAGTAVFARLYGAAVLAAQAITSLFRAAVLATAATVKGIGAIFAASAVAARVYGAATLGAAAAVKVLRAAFLGFAAIGSLAAAVVAGMSAILATLGAGLAVLLSPIALVVGAIGGIGYAFLGASKQGETARATMGQTWQGIKTAAVSAWQGISDAVASGDMGLAMQIAGKALQVVWLNIVAGLKGAWLEFTGFLESTLLTVGAALVKVWANIVAGMKSIWLELTNAVGTLADGAKDAGRSLVQIDPKKVEALRAERKALDDREGPNVEKRKAELDDLLKRVDDLKKPAGEKRQQEMEAKRAEIGKELQDREKGVDERLAGQKRDIEDRNKGRVADLMKEAVDAQKELDKLNADAKAKREGKVVPGGDKRDALGAAIGGLGLVGVDLLKKAEPLGLGGGATGPAEGTFSALATRGLGGDNIQTKQLQELEKLVENGKKQLDALKGAGLVAK